MGYYAWVSERIHKHKKRTVWSWIICDQLLATRWPDFIRKDRLPKCTQQYIVKIEDSWTHLIPIVSGFKSALPIRRNITVVYIKIKSGALALTKINLTILQAYAISKRKNAATLAWVTVEQSRPMSMEVDQHSPYVRGKPTTLASRER